MSVITSTAAPAPPNPDQVGLRKNHLSFLEVLAQSIGTIAPSGTPGLVIPVVFATAGNGTWLAYLFATVALFIVGLQINVFSSRVASPGSLYVYVAHGLGPLLGVIAGWALLIGYVFTAAAVIDGTVSVFIAFLGALRIVTVIPGFVVALSVIALALAWTLAYRDIKLSTRVTLAIEFTTLALILVAVVGFFLHRGTVADPVQTGLVGVNPDQLRLGLVLAFFSFVGFESATVLGTESRQPRRFIPRAVIASVLGVGLIFIISAYGLTAAFHGAPVTLDKSDAPLTVLAASFGAGWVGIIILAGVALSFFACILGSINAGGRVLFTLSHHGLVHASARKTHSTHASPHTAVSVVSLIALALAIGLAFAGYAILDAYGILGSLATYGFLVAYGLVTIGAPAFLRRRGELNFGHIISTIVAFGLLMVALVGTVYPVPAWPYNILPYLFVALLAVGVIYFLILRGVAPQRLAQIEADLLASTIVDPV
jgi:amino acid transporter